MAGRVEELLDASGAKLEFIACGGAEDLHAVAGRNDESFTNDVAVDELAQATGTRFVVEGKSLADLYRSCFVIDSDENDGHFFSHKNHKLKFRVQALACLPNNSLKAEL